MLGLGKPMNVFCRQLIPDIFTVFFVIGLRWGQLFVLVPCCSAAEILNGVGR